MKDYHGQRRKGIARTGDLVFLIGEEELETVAGAFKTLHVKVPTEHNTTELWLALDRGLLPIKIRHIDRKGETTELIVTEIGTPQQ